MKLGKKVGLGIAWTFIITLLSIVTVAGELSNMNSFVIRSGNMEPFLKPNDMVSTSNSTPFDNLKIGDVIAFRASEGTEPNGIIVSRVSDVSTFHDKKVFKTKGDANPYSIPGIDFPIFKENYIGKVVSVTHRTLSDVRFSNQTDTNQTVTNNGYVDTCIQVGTEKVCKNWSPVEKAILKRIDVNSIRMIDNETGYMCIQLQENISEKICKNWTNDGLRPVFLNIFKEDDELNRYTREHFALGVQDTLNLVQGQLNYDTNQTNHTKGTIKVEGTAIEKEHDEGKSLSTNANAGTIRIEGTMSEPDADYALQFPGDNRYYFPKDGIFEINKGKICPSGQCKVIPENESSMNQLELRLSEKYMAFSGNYRLQDDITNGHFTPKKQKLVEEMGITFQCNFDDIQEDLKNNITKYICTGKNDIFAGGLLGGNAIRNFNSTFYPFTSSASFELPSRHFVLNAEDVE
jgi:signal peptidase I